MAKFSYRLCVAAVICAITVSAWEPPKLPAGRRVQYYILHPDGNYVYGYDTGEGITHAARSSSVNRVSVHGQQAGQSTSGTQGYSYSGVASSVDSSLDGSKSDASYSFSYDAGDHSRRESADASGNVKGSFSFTAKDGVGRKVDYEAGAEKGFVAEGAHLPVAAPPAQALVHTAAFVSKGSGTQLGADVINAANVDKSYGFSYNAGDHSRSESADKDGSVRGSFAFTAKDGVERKVEYEAGAAKGFIAKGSHLPTSVFFQAPQIHQVTPFRFPQTAPSAPTTDTKHASNLDKSYSFAYTADDHSRQESADSAGNVRGHFSFVAKDGVNRKIEYEAGAKKGFVAKGDHIPVAPVPIAPIATPTSYYSQNSVTQVHASSNVESSPVDGSYSFNYNAGDHSRQETADALGNVKGSYSFVASDGVNREVDYEAGAEKGFVAKGSHIPEVSGPLVAVPAFPSATSYHAPIPISQVQTPSNIHSGSEDASYSFSYNAGDHSRQESSDDIGNVKGYYSFVAKDGVNRKVDYEAGAEKGFVAKGTHLPALSHLPAALPSIVVPSTSYSKIPSTDFNSASSVAGSSVDKSYSFSYDAGDHSRQESADSAGNVRGHFSFVAKDGVNRKVDYEAGAEKGFLATGDHIPTDASFGTKSISGSLSTGHYTSSFQTANTQNDNFPSAAVISSAPVGTGYSFSYDAGDHGRDESSDLNGNLKGNYRFVAKDGINRKVEYEAGAEKGFVAKGEHLPVSPVVSGVGDLSYKYSYETDTSSKTEESDSAGNVFGSFSYIGPDGLTRKVDYRAGGNDGFVPTVTHEQGRATAGVKQFTSVPLASSSTFPVSSFSSTSAISPQYESHVKVTPSEPFSVRTFLPHTSPTKFGYIYDTLV